MSTHAECKNCGASLVGRYCSACGQPADVRIPSFGQIVFDAVADAFSFDSRVWRSLCTLVLPGRLTSRFLEGQRARYTPPFRLYVVTSLVFFAVVSLSRAVSDAVPPEPSAPDAERAEAPSPTTSGTETFGITADEKGWTCDLDADVPPQLRERLVAACEKISADSGASFSRAFADHFPVMMVLFIPLIAVLMKVLYAFSGRKYVEHLLFLAHVHTFFFLTGIVTFLLWRSVGLVSFLEWPVSLVSFVAWSYFPVYLYLALRHVYRQGHLLTALKYALLGGGYVIAFIATLLGLIVYTAVTI